MVRVHIRSNNRIKHDVAIYKNEGDFSKFWQRILKTHQTLIKVLCISTTLDILMLGWSLYE